VAADTWTDRELRILESIAQLEDEVKQSWNLTDELVIQQTGIERRQVHRSLRSLQDGGYLTYEDASSMTGDGMAAIELRGMGRREIGQWPNTDPADGFLRALQQVIATTEDPDERTRIQKLLSAAGDVTKQVLAGAIVTAGASLR
jgi:hypothetical protein